MKALEKDEDDGVALLAGRGVAGASDDDDAAASTSGSATVPLHRRQPAQLAIMTATLALSYMDRQVLSTVFEPLRAELHLSDAQLGFLSGVALSVFGVLFGVAIARHADRASRRRVLVACVAAWSLFTAASGLARSFGQLAALRLLVGVGEAGCVPVCQSLIGDGWPLQARARAMSVYFCAIPGGILLGLFVGGWLGQAAGWRAAMIATGLSGLPVAAAAQAFLHEPPRGFSDRVGGAPPPPPHAQQPAGDVARELLRCRAYVYVVCGGGLILFTAIGTFAFMPTLLMRVHGWELGASGSALSGVMLFGAAATVAGGWAADALMRRSGSMAPLGHVPAAAVLASVPFGCWMCSAGSGGAAVALFLLPTCGANVWSGPSKSLISALVPPDVRATAVSASEALNGVLGGLGPLAVGALSDRFRRGGAGDSAALQRAMLAVQFVALGAAFCFWRAGANADAGAAARREAAAAELERAAFAEVGGEGGDAAAA